MTRAAWARVDRALWSYREMTLPCLSLLAVSVLGYVLGHGLFVLFGR